MPNHGGEFLTKGAQSIADSRCALADLNWLPDGSDNLVKPKRRALQGPISKSQCPLPHRVEALEQKKGAVGLGGRRELIVRSRLNGGEWDRQPPRGHMRKERTLASVKSRSLRGHWPLLCKRASTCSARATGYPCGPLKSFTNP